MYQLVTTASDIIDTKKEKINPAMTVKTVELQHITVVEVQG